MLHDDETMRPASWLTEHRALLPASGTALDVACGRGRHALWLAEHGFDVRALDRHAEAIQTLAAAAVTSGLSIDARVVDLERDHPNLGVGAFDVIVVVHYLHRPLFPHLIAALRPCGVLVYETFTRAQALRGRPTNPDFLLEPGELRARLAGLEILADREGEDGNRCIASVVARKTA